MFFLNRIIRYLLFSFVYIIQTTHPGAGILPYAFHKKTNTYYFLIGKEAYGKPKNTWCDFGGRIEPIDSGSFLKNAVREFCEESGYPIKSKYSLQKQIEKNPKVKHPYYRYYMYFAQVPYRPAVTLKGDGEKSEYAWIPFNQFIQSLGKEFYKMGKISNNFSYNGKTYVLRKDFRECLCEFLKYYDPKKEHYYFKSKNPKTILKRVLNI